MSSTVRTTPLLPSGLSPLGVALLVGLAAVILVSVEKGAPSVERRWRTACRSLGSRPAAGAATIARALEKAVRASVVLGLVGAGGIGQEPKVAFDPFQHPHASTIILAMFLIVLGMEDVTDRLRARVQ